MTAHPENEEGRYAFILANALSTILNILDPVTDENGQADGEFIRWTIDHTFSKCPVGFIEAAEKVHEGAKYAWRESMRREQ